VGELHVTEEIGLPMISAASDFHHDMIKDLVDRAVKTGRQFQSTQTGWVHYHPNGDSTHSHQAIPLYENALFILSLFRSRLVQQVQEAKCLLNQMLHFQSPSTHFNSGNFPVWMHQYPEAGDYANGLKMSAPLIHMLAQFGGVIGHELKSALECSLTRLLEYFLAIDQSQLNYVLKIRLNAALIALGKLLKKEQWIQEGESKMSPLALEETCIYSSSQLAELMVSLQLMDPHLETSFGKSLKAFVQQIWHRTTCSYAGPVLKERQDGFEPQFNLLDLILGYNQGLFSKRIESASITHLQGALVFPPHLFSLEKAFPFVIEGKYGPHSWLSLQTETTAISLMDWNSVEGPTEKYITPLRILWGSSILTHSLIAFGRIGTQVSCLTASSTHLELVYTLDAHFAKEERDLQEEIHLYFDASPQTQVTLNGLKGTVFALNDSLEILTEGKKTHSLKFELIEGDGDFIGHLALGNRPSQQRSVKTELQAYDWHVFLRAARRSSQCAIKLSIFL